MRPDLVIFDCDGVLVDSEPPVFQVVTAELRALGLDVTLEETMATHKGKTLEQSRPLIEATMALVSASFFSVFCLVPLLTAFCVAASRFAGRPSCTALPSNSIVNRWRLSFDAACAR